MTIYRCFALKALLLPAVAYSYGLDCSFPIHHQDQFEASNDCPGLQHRIQAFREYKEGCHRRYNTDPEACDHGEEGRLAMNRDQPQSMVNFTDSGYMLMSGNDRLREMLQEFWDTNQNFGIEEEWGNGDIHTNHWQTKIEMISVNDDNEANRHLISGATEEFRNAILQAVQPTIEEWTGMKQTSTSLYGVRVYREGAVLSPHCDRLPLVSSAIVNVAQDVDEDWPLEVYGRDGIAHNITKKPGDIILYESASVIHGRPFPLKGRYFANIFIHFEPVAYLNGDPFVNKDDPELPPFLVPGKPTSDHYKRTMNYDGEEETDHEIVYPDDHDYDYDYIGDESESEDEDEDEEEDDWEGKDYYGDEDWEDDFEEVNGVHVAAENGDLESLQYIARDQTKALHLEDKQGSKPLHLAVQSGNHDAVKFLLENGADYDERNLFGVGASPLNMALQFGEDHPIVTLLIDRGAKDVASEWEHDEF